MFLHLYVILFTGGALPPWGRGSASRGSLYPEGEVWLREGLHPGGSASRGLLGRPPSSSDTTEYGQHAVGTHPTGMHSCLETVPVLYVYMVIKTYDGDGSE